MPGAMGHFLLGQIYRCFPSYYEDKVVQMNQRYSYMQQKSTNHHAEPDLRLPRHDIIEPHHLSWLFDNHGSLHKTVLLHNYNILPKRELRYNSIINITCNGLATQHTCAFLSWIKNGKWHIKSIQESVALGNNLYQETCEEMHRYTKMYMPYPESHCNIEFWDMKNPDNLLGVLGSVARHINTNRITPINRVQYTQTYANTLQPIHKHEELYQNMMWVYSCLQQYAKDPVPQYQDAFKNDTKRFKYTVEQLFKVFE
jgi:hypothetical protein